MLIITMRVVVFGVVLKSKLIVTGFSPWEKLLAVTLVGRRGGGLSWLIVWLAG